MIPGSIIPHFRFVAQIYASRKDEGGRHKAFFSGYRRQFFFRTTDVKSTLLLDDESPSSSSGWSFTLFGLSNRHTSQQNHRLTETVAAQATPSRWPNARRHRLMTVETGQAGGLEEGLGFAVRGGQHDGRCRNGR